MAFLLAKPTPHNVNHDNDRFSMFNKKRDIAFSYRPKALFAYRRLWQKRLSR